MFYELEKLERHLKMNKSVMKALREERTRFEIENIKLNKEIQSLQAKLKSLSPVAIDEMPTLDVGKYVDIFNAYGGRFPDAIWRIISTGESYWESASGHEISKPTHYMLPPKIGGGDEG
ncbi:MAG: hypothetical protein COA43_01210 [Robiginitomaculum sp.]|nr:MAG: hypothetical protein COA43_01210 [Robiginitomaculum sp.]